MKRVLTIALALFFYSCTEQVKETSHEQERLSDKVYPQLDAAHSRWFFFASACRPFGMVTLNPDTQVGGAWGSGYRYDTDTIKGFSHIHGWQISGVSVMPVTYSDSPESLFDDYYSQFDHKDEIAEVGYHKVALNRYGINAELTSTKRVGFHRYEFTDDQLNGVLFNLGGQLGPSEIKDAKLEIVDSRTIKGKLVNAPTRRRPKDFNVYFAVQFDQDHNGFVESNSVNKLVSFDRGVKKLKMKVGISYTSYENALLNIQEELPEWDFDQIVEASKSEWDSYLGRIKISENDSISERRFYTDLWHALQGRRTINDVNGAYPDNTGDEFRVGQLPLDEAGRPKFNHYNSDAFWGAQWTLTTLWGLVYPEIYEEFVNSLMVYYRDGGLVPRGPSGGNYTYVMTGATSTPFIVSAIQKGIGGFATEEVYEALKKNHMPGGIMSKAGYEHDTFKGGALEHYITNGFVPYPVPEGKFGVHQDGGTLTCEYAYQDWTLAQFAQLLGKTEDYDYFMKRSKNYQNQFDKETGWMRPKNIDGVWRKNFDPYSYQGGFNESNGAQSTWFVGHDLEGLAELMGGTEKAVDKLNEQFEEAEKLGFTSGTSHAAEKDPKNRRIPINYGNQPSIQTAFIFSHLGRPDLTQKWSSAVASTAFGGLTPYTGFNGDEDQGLMGSLAVLMKIGLFQMNGGTEENPKYELGSPMFGNVEITLPTGKKLLIEKSGQGVIAEKIMFNGKEVNALALRHDQIMQGGKLQFIMTTASK